MGWQSLGQPALVPKFQILPLRVVGVQSGATELEIFLRAFGDDAIDHLIETFNLTVPLRKSPENALRRWELLRYFGMHLFAQLHDELHLQQLCNDDVKCDGFLGRRRFFFIHENRHFDPQLLTDRLTASFSRLVEQGNAFVMDELKSPYHGQTRLVTFTARKPHPWGIDMWLLCGRFANGRPYCLRFMPRLVAGRRYRVIDIARHLLAPYFERSVAHLTVDAFYDAAALRALIQESNTNSGTQHTYTFSGHTAHDPKLWKTLHFEVEKGSWLAYENTNTGELITCAYDNKVFNTRSTHFELRRKRRDADDSALRLHYKAEFGGVDLFNRLFYARYWHRRELTAASNLYNSLLGLAVTNAYSAFCAVRPHATCTITDFMAALSEQLLAVPQSL